MTTENGEIDQHSDSYVGLGHNEANRASAVQSDRSREPTERKALPAAHCARLQNEADAVMSLTTSPSQSIRAISSLRGAHLHA